MSASQSRYTLCCVSVCFSETICTNTIDGAIFSTERSLMSSSVGSLQNLGKTELTPTGVSVFIRGLATTSPGCGGAAQKDRTSYRSELTRVATRNTSPASLLLLRSIFLESFVWGKKCTVQTGRYVQHFLQSGNYTKVMLLP